jgi:hypothetical protein
MNIGFGIPPNVQGSAKRWLSPTVSVDDFQVGTFPLRVTNNCHFATLSTREQIGTQAQRYVT